MLIHVLGPQDEMETNGILRAIRMPKDPAFSKLSTATGYVRDWKDALRWCRTHVPRGKVLVKSFLANVYPRKLANSLENTLWTCRSTCRTPSLDPWLLLRRLVQLLQLLREFPKLLRLLLFPQNLTTKTCGSQSRLAFYAVKLDISSRIVPRRRLQPLTVDLSGVSEESERLMRMTGAPRCCGQGA